MAKKKVSARSKGYRKTVKKRPFLTKKEILILVAIVAVIALAIILFKVFYDDGSLEVDADGSVVTENFDTSLILRDGGTTENPRYFKVAEVGEIEGFARTREENIIDANRGSFLYTPEDQTSPVSIAISAGTGTPLELLQSNLTSSYGENYMLTNIAETEIDGITLEYLVSTNNYANSENDATICLQELTALMTSPMNEDYSVVIRVKVQGESEELLDAQGVEEMVADLYLTDEDLLSYLELAVPAVHAESASDAQ